MLRQRIIPCLLLSRGGLVKTTRFRKPKYIGDPINAIRIFNQKQVDELIVLDIDASKNNTDPDYALIEQFASECFMPLCYGGGITTVEQAYRLFSMGVEKVSVQAGALRNLELITELSNRFGSQSIVASVDIKKDIFGRMRLYESHTGKYRREDWQEYLFLAETAGAGEILLNSVDRDGMMTGMDLKMISCATSRSKVPIIASGGVGSLTDIARGLSSGASAIAAGAFFVFHGPHRAVLITYPSPDEIEMAQGIS
jgi:cyclase